MKEDFVKYQCRECHETLCTKSHNLKGVHLDLSCNITTSTDRSPKWYRIMSESELNKQTKKEIPMITKQEEPELMTMRKAYKKSNPHDTLRCEENENDTFECRSDYIYDKSIPFRFANSEKWQIIKAEPVILSANQSYLKSSVYKENYRKPPKEYIVGFNDGDKNGQLKELLRTHKLLCAIQILSNNCDHDGLSSLTKNVIDEFENLKPLNKE